MAEIQDLHVLITHESFDEAARLSSVLDNSGFRVRASQVQSKEDLAKELKNSHIDIILAQAALTAPKPAELLQEIKRLNKDIPVLIIDEALSGSQIAQSLRMGAKDMVCIDEAQHLVAVVNRELAAKNDRAKHRDIMRRFYASENRYQQLLQYARLPMAIVQESMFVLVNEAFLELFNIDPEDAELMPIFDILDKEGQASFKTLYKSFMTKPEAFPGAELKTTLVNAEDDNTSVTIDVNPVKYNDEDALQLKVDLDLVQASTVVAEADDGLTPRRLFVGHIESCINIAQTDEADSALLNIQIDAFDKIQDQLGLSASESLYDTFCQYIVDQFADLPVCQFQENRLIVLLQEIDSNTALAKAEALAAKMTDHVFEFGEMSQQLSITVGVSIISDLVTNADTAIKQAYRAAEQLVERTTTGYGNGALLFEPEKLDDDEDVDINFLLKQAFKHEHLQIMFQPMLQFHGTPGKHYEVLLGIKPEHKDTYPDDFIAMACRSNENHEIDRWVILEALRVLMRKTNCVGDESLYIHVSKQSLENDKFMAWLQAAVIKSKLNASQLNFQLREVDVSSHLKKAAQMVAAIKKVKANTVITHFGCSVQPLKLLDSIAFDAVKVDGSFIQEAQKPGGKTEELSELLEQIKERDKVSIVPMVESATVLPVLWKSSVGYIQGYYVQPPSAKMDYKF